MAFVMQDVRLVGLNGLFWLLNIWIGKRKEEKENKKKNKSPYYSQRVSAFWKQSQRDCRQLGLEMSAGHSLALRLFPELPKLS